MLGRAKATSRCSRRPSQSWKPPASAAVTKMSEQLDIMQDKQAPHQEDSPWSVISKLPGWASLDGTSRCSFLFSCAGHQS